MVLLTESLTSLFSLACSHSSRAAAVGKEEPTTIGGATARIITGAEKANGTPWIILEMAAAAMITGATTVAKGAMTTMMSAAAAAEKYAAKNEATLVIGTVRSAEDHGRDVEDVVDQLESTKRNTTISQ